MGSSSQNTTSNTSQNTKYNQSTSPWGPQQTAITGIYNQLPNAYAQSSQATAPADYVATMTPQQLAVFNAMSGSGMNLTGPGTAAAMAGGATLPAAYSNAESALTNLNSYDPTKYNNAGNVLGVAKQYVNGVNIPAEVQNAMQSAVETARDVTNPGIVNTAASSGNVNSSRTDLAQGLVDRALAEQAGNLSGALQNKAWDTGASLGENLANAQQTGSLDALASALSGGTSLGSSAANSINTGVNATSNAFNLAGVGASGAQNNNQLTLQNQLEQYLYGVQSPYASLDQAANIAMNGNWGSNTSGTQQSTGTSNSTTTSNPSAFQVIGGLMGAGGSLLGGTGLGATGMGATGIMGLLSALKQA